MSESNSNIRQTDRSGNSINDYAEIPALDLNMTNSFDGQDVTIDEIDVIEMHPNVIEIRAMSHLPIRGSAARNRTSFRLNNLYHYSSARTQNSLPNSYHRAQNSSPNGRHANDVPRYCMRVEHENDRFCLPTCIVCLRDLEILHIDRIIVMNTSCGHLICAECANGLLDAAESGGSPLRCPVCRRLLHDPELYDRPAIFRLRM